jgi:glucose-1-phosphate thymidylyltransferase
MDTGTPDLLVDAGRFVQATEKQQGVKIGCPEELAFRRGFIDRSILEDSVRKYFGTSYGNYLSTL